MASSGVRERRRCDWSHLPCELLELISRKLSDIADYVRFGAVCKSWRSAASPNNLGPQLPWLLLPYDRDSSTRRFFSLSGHRVYTLDLPESRGHFIVGTANGWLLMADIKPFALSLLNPLTRARIHLPPIHRSRVYLFDTLNGFYPQMLFWRHCYFRCYVFVSGGEYIAAITDSSSMTFMYCRAGEEAWTMLNPVSISLIEAITYHKERFYVIDQRGEVVVWDLRPQTKATLIQSLEVALPFERCYFVALAGELLLVACCLDESNKKERRFTVYRLDASGLMTWSKLEDIGDHTLFSAFAENTIIAVASDSSGGRRNCIYYVADCGNVSPRVYQVELVSIQDGSKEQLPCPLEVDRSGLLQPTWLTPSLY